MSIIDDVLIVTVDRDLDEERLTNIQDAVLNKITTRTIKGVVLDFSSVELLDSYLAKKMTDLSKMIEVMGSIAIISGLRPEVIASLVMLGFTSDNLTTALNVEYGVEYLNSLLNPIEEFNNEIEEEITGEEEVAVKKSGLDV